MRLCFDVPDNAPIMVADKRSTILIWIYADTPEVYRKVIGERMPETFVALVPPFYSRDVRHITLDPYFASKHLDTYTLDDESTLYVGE